LITIDYDFKSNEKSIIVIERDKQFDAVRAICENKFRDLAPSSIDKIVEITEGFPEMIGIVEGAFKSGAREKMYGEIPDDFIERYLFGRESKNVNDYELLKACSIFTHFKFFDDKYHEVIDEKLLSKIKKQEKLIYSVISKHKSDSEMFYQFCIKYRDEKKLLEQRGLNLKVIPEPIAANLASAWWIETSFERIQEMLPEITDAELLTELCDRLVDLNQLSKAKDIVSRLWDPKSPFASAEALNSELGSRLFRSVVEVNPVAMAHTLLIVFGKMNKDELLNIEQGRRNLVWALEKLSFRKETFATAAKILYAFAVSENERYSNNATGQFVQLFQIRLPGTEVDYKSRLDIIEYGLSKKDDDYSRIAIFALSQGLQTHGLTRMLGAEQQGSSRPLQDYRPSSMDEVKEYHKRIYEILLLIARENKTLVPIVKKQVARNVRDTIENHGIQFVKDAITELQSYEPTTWYDMINNLRITIRHGTLSDEEIKEVHTLIELLLPTDIAGQIETLISKPGWDHEKLESGSFVDKGDKRAEEFAEEFVKAGTDIKPYLPYLLQGEQRKTMVFGKTIGQLAADKNEILFEAIDCLKTLPKDKQSVELLIGLLYNFEEEERRKIILELIQTPNIGFNIIYLARWYLKKKEDLLKLLSLVDTGILNVHQIKILSYSNFDENISADDLSIICNKIYSFNVEGKWIALEMLGNYCYRNNERFLQIMPLLQVLTTGFNYLTSNLTVDAIDDFTYSQLIQKLLIENPNEELARIFSHQIYEYFDEYRPTFSDLYVNEISKALIERYFSIFWEEISPCILEDGNRYYNLQYVLGAHQGNFQTYAKKGALFSGDTDIIIEWCKRNSPLAPIKIASIMPISKIEGTSPSWDPFALQMINEFGDIQGFLDGVESNVRSFGWTGSTIPYYEGVKTLMKELLGHKIELVDEWAQMMIENLDKSILREKIENAERFIN